MRTFLLGLLLFGACTFYPTDVDPGLDAGVAGMDAGSAAIDAPVDAPNGPSLILFLHGLGVDGPTQAHTWALDTVALHRNAMILAPAGSPNAEGNLSWNASTACCQDKPTKPDDEAALVAQVIAVRDANSIDPRRVYVIGVSNGGTMAWRLVCDHPELFSAVAIVAGAANTPRDGANAKFCNIADPPTAILHIHGTADPIMGYGVSTQVMADMDLVPAVVGPTGSLAQEAKIERCRGSLVFKAAGAYDHDSTVPGAETDVLAYEGCDAPVEHWRMNGSTHASLANPQEWFSDDVYTWLDHNHR